MHVAATEKERKSDRAARVQVQTKRKRRESRRYWTESRDGEPRQGIKKARGIESELNASGRR
jgi:hypothetical protein